MKRSGSRRADHFTRRAQKQNYPARSVFKLEEIDRKYKLIKPEDTVLDLGCSPGSWLLYASKKIGPKGVVVGVDQHSLKIPLPSNARFLQFDALSLDSEILGEVHSPNFDLVLSDMAPHTSGSRFVDQQRSLRLFLRAITLARELSRVGSSFLGKVFQSEDAQEARELAQQWYSTVKIVRPQATRKQSYEVYFLCQHRKKSHP